MTAFLASSCAMEHGPMGTRLAACVTCSLSRVLGDDTPRLSCAGRTIHAYMRLILVQISWLGFRGT